MKITEIRDLELYAHPIETKGRINSLNGELDDIRITGEGYLCGQKVYTTYYKGIVCTSIFNPFVGCYYTDDKYGQIEIDFSDWDKEVK